jgi:hypothetical protein
MTMAALAGVLLAPAALAGDKTAAASAGDKVTDDERLICRKTLETGSLVRKSKQCFTKAQWDEIAAQTRVGNQKVADQLSTACGMDGGVCP